MESPQMIRSGIDDVFVVYLNRFDDGFVTSLRGYYGDHLRQRYAKISVRIVSVVQITILGPQNKFVDLLLIFYGLYVVDTPRVESVHVMRIVGRLQLQSSVQFSRVEPYHQPRDVSHEPIVKRFEYQNPYEYANDERKYHVSIVKHGTVITVQRFVAPYFRRVRRDLTRVGHVRFSTSRDRSRLCEKKNKSFIF
jgi:hypothetical protein